MEAYTSTLGLYLLTHSSVRIMLLYLIWSLSPGSVLAVILPLPRHHWLVNISKTDENVLFSGLTFLEIHMLREIEKVLYYYLKYR